MQKAHNEKYKHFSKIVFTSCIIYFLILLNNPVHAQNDLDVIKDIWMEYSDAPNSLYHYLTDQCYGLLDKRGKSVSQLNTLAGWQDRQKYIRETLMDIVGPFPEKTPLNAKIVKTIDKGSYKVEHIIFESVTRILCYFIIIYSGRIEETRQGSCSYLLQRTL